MLETLLGTTLFIPPLRPNRVPRPHLIERLSEDLHRKLTLVSDPTGFGKSTLVNEWFAEGERPAARLSLDDGDNNPARFLAYFFAALQKIALYLGERTIALLQLPQLPPTESILTTLLDEIATIPGSFILALDDNHVISAKLNNYKDCRISS